MTMPNGESERPRAPLELSETLYIETDEGASFPFEVVGVVEDPEEGVSYAVLHRESTDDEDDEFIVTDLEGTLLQDERLAQEILDEFLEFADESGNDRGAPNGETK
jgi:hypothetical protein